MPWPPIVDDVAVRFDAANRRLVTAVPKYILGSFRIQVHAFVEGRPSLLAESRIVSLDNSGTYTISVTPSFVYQGFDNQVQIKFDHKPYQEFLKTATVSFNEIRVKPVDDTSQGGLIVKVPTELMPDTTVKVQAHLGDDHLLDSIPVEGLTVLASSRATGASGGRLLDWILPIAALFILGVGMAMIGLVYYLRRLQLNSATENERLRKLLQDAAAGVEP